MSVFADLVARLAELLEPLFHASATAAAIVLFTAFVRLLVHPLSRASARGQRARVALQPQIAELRKKHAKDPKELQKAVLELHKQEKVSPLSGCLPSLCQLPAFFLLYHLFSNTTIGGEANELLTHQLFAAPLGDRWADALGEGGVFGAQGLVYVGLFVIVAGVAAFNFRRTKLMMAANPLGAAGVAGVPGAGGDEKVPGMAESMATVSKLMPFMSFLTLLTVAVVPLAAALYVVTSTTWSAVERAFLYPVTPAAPSASAASAK
ncbi:YidC/Oxa1 family membrane protein insertase [Streptomyces ipomoeae]|jgi:YidC/Oxa1 family membrane protein insertase|uniref:YidC/Oxa1 family membrane protein insertase n=1 Tax=Streptomyces ipomoeae TaxID=103232 RepID=UPI00114624C0|nr:YidC/Oxa1 family membrane protein insertase [Streptomyces ipomoeae]MDX2826949.1 YidC/Oxa1 family membrane protein insertase [Streptomyces ipomoeae]MDX2879622.1 YidC/Oxa1 family membrane protein insertase [Streptomyces ipomoeae]MDX2936931.1 YidC/Oxa1 family membrane protein insertase [Streptomyces ipomoeae]TQE31356.1 YidC/Oxa1 family membrane protein insertase [Streptomyces ipomoeae]TQE31969.1 YidC/Oxa1 family membrane protein insertase [Streptomyces ipomoeae]